MARAETTGTARGPRGAKPVAQAFLAALDSVPEAARSAVVKAAQMMIRDELTGAAAKRAPKAAVPESAEPAAAAPAKRRSRKQAGTPVA